MIRSRPLASYFVLAYAISWALWAPLWLPALGVTGLPVLPFHHALGALGPVGAAFLVSAVSNGRNGSLDLVRRMVAFRGGAGWVAVGLLGPLAVLGIAAGVGAAAGEEVAFGQLGRSAEFPAFTALGFLAYNLVSFGYGEEVGWRGFALPRLQARRSAFAATLLLTLGWAGWHIPLFLYRPGYAEMGAAGIAGWAVSLLTGSILLTWLYNSSRGSLLAVALFHASMDVAFTSRVASPLVVNTAGALVTAWGIAVLAVGGFRHLSRNGKVVWAEGRGSVARFVARGVEEEAPRR